MNPKTAVLVLLVAFPLRAAAQEKTDAGRQMKKPSISMTAMNTPEETFGCPAGWKGNAVAKPKEAGAFEGWCSDKHRWFAADRGRNWAEASLNRLDTLPAFGGLAAYLHGLQACAGGIRYSWCGKLAGTMQVDGQKATILESIPDDARSASEIKSLELIFADGHRAYSIRLFAPKEKFDDDMPYFSAILASFHAR